MKQKKMVLSLRNALQFLINASELFSNHCFRTVPGLMLADGYMDKLSKALQKQQFSVYKQVGYCTHGSALRLDTLSVDL